MPSACNSGFPSFYFSPINNDKISNLRSKLVLITMLQNMLFISTSFVTYSAQIVFIFDKKKIAQKIYIVGRSNLKKYDFFIIVGRQK